jgi:rfaE bifunctional protein nucleotidyltransferase chain/domain
METIILCANEKEINICENNIHIKQEKHEHKDYKEKVCIKPWGYEYLIYQSKKVGIWFLNIKKYQSTSLHCHFNKDTILIVLKGTLKVKLIDDELSLDEMTSAFIPHYKFHGFSCFTDEVYVMEIEIYNKDIDFSDKNDLLRINDIYKRENTGYENSVNAKDVDSVNFEEQKIHPYFYLDDDFNQTILETDIQINVINKNNNELLESIKEKNNNYNILLDGNIFQKFSYLKEGTFIKHFDDLQFIEDKITVLSINNQTHINNSKIIHDVEQLKLKIKNLKNNNKKIILSSGCFDILHVGHINTLFEAKKLGDVLMVCLSSDEQIKLLKGKDRPINNYNDRINLFKTISYVDYIILYDEQNIEKEETLGEIMKITSPEFWVKGSDYTENDIYLKHPYLNKIKLIKNIENKSTTKIVQKCKTSV